MTETTPVRSVGLGRGGRGRGRGRGQGAPEIVDVGKPCRICNDPKQPNGNPILICDGDGCDVYEHLVCAKLGSVPDGDWLCSDCQGEIHDKAQQAHAKDEELIDSHIVSMSEKYEYLKNFDVWGQTASTESLWGRKRKYKPKISGEFVPASVIISTLNLSIEQLVNCIVRWINGNQLAFVAFFVG